MPQATNEVATTPQRSSPDPPRCYPCRSPRDKQSMCFSIQQGSALCGHLKASYLIVFYLNNKIMMTMERRRNHSEHLFQNQCYFQCKASMFRALHSQDAKIVNSQRSAVVAVGLSVFVCMYVFNDRERTDCPKKTILGRK